MKKIRKIRMTLMMFAFMFGLMNVGALRAQAASPSVDKSVTYNIYKDGPNSPRKLVLVRNAVQNAKITNLKSSNSKVAKVTLNKWPNGYYSISLDIRKAGVTNISFQYNGKTLKQKVTVVQYKNPCQSFKIGKKDYKKYFQKSGNYQFCSQKKDLTGTISIKPKKGWKLKKLELWHVSSSSMGRGVTSTKKIKNNSKVTVTIKDLGTTVYAEFKNVKTKATQKVEFGYYPGKGPTGNWYE